MKDSLVQPADRIGTLKPYTPPPRDPRVSLMLDNNEGTPIDASVLSSIRDLDPDALSRYPDASDLERSIARRLGTEPSRIIVTNGGDDAIDRVCRSMLGPGDALLMHAPSFVMITRYALLSGASTNLVEWIEGDFPQQAMLDSINERTKLIALVSPNNPTGAIIDTDSILAIAKKAQLFGAVVLLDQAYIEFADEDPIEHVLDLPNIVIVRTFSKAMGLAGQRIGYAIGPEQIIDWLRTVGGPYPVSVISLVLAQVAFEESAERAEPIVRTIENRAQLIDSLTRLGIRVLPSHANFVLAQFEDSLIAHTALLEQGVSVRRFKQGGAIDSYLRITVPSNSVQLSQLLNAFDAIGATS